MPKRYRSSFSNAVRKIVRQELPRPEWKCLQIAEQGFPYTASTNWGVVDLTSYIAPGTTASDRIGRSIRVHRVDVWVEWRAPEEPFCLDLRCTTGLLRAEHPTLGDPTVLPFDAIYDSYARGTSPGPAVAGDYLDPRWGPAPVRVDLQQTYGWHILHNKRIDLRACPRRIQYAVESGAHQDPEVENKNDIMGTFSGFSSTGAGAQNQAGSALTRFWIQDKQNVPFRRRFRLTSKWRGKGLFVDFSDETEPDVVQDFKNNHLYLYFVSTVPPTPPVNVAHQPSFNYCARIWFTDE